jgi:hypothetical protein
MSRSQRLGGIIAMALSMTGMNAASAQDDPPRLSNSVTQATSVLNADKQSRVDQYIDYWLAELAGSSYPEVISSARARLGEPFRMAGVSDIFTTAYSAAMTKKLGNALKSDSVLVRINGMIIVEYVIDANAVAMVRDGLEDENVAVRYRAAKAAGQIALKDQASKKLDQNSKGELLKALLATMRIEQNFNVREQALIAMQHLAELPDARTALLNEINDRLLVQVQNINMRTDAPLVCLRSLYRRLVRLAEKAPKQEIHQIIPVAARWLALSARVLRSQKAEPGAEGQYAKMAELCHTILGWACNKCLAPELESKAPKDVLDKIKKRNWLELNLKMEEWKVHLQQQPINIEPQVITIPQLQ